MGLRSITLVWLLAMGGLLRKQVEALLVPSGNKGLCVLGCTPYIDPYRIGAGILKYDALIEEMAETCDVIVHVGDTKPGKMPCNETLMTQSVHKLIEAGRRHDTLVLYAPGDNEVNDCHRHASAPADSDRRVPSQIVRATDARAHLVNDLKLFSGKDLTGKFCVDEHDMSGKINQATCLELATPCLPYSCDFDKYVEFDDFAVATLEVLGSHWYLDDERYDRPGQNYPLQDEVDPLASRLPLYVNAKDCAVEWIGETARRASESGKSAVFFMLHATFYQKNGVSPIASGAIGTYYNRTNLARMTKEIGEEVARPYYPLFDAFVETALKYPDIMFQIVHSDSHRFLSTRLLPHINNHKTNIGSHHNVMIHQVEGHSRALTMYSRFTVDPAKFQPITLHQEWSRSAYNEEPVGHAFIGY